MARKPSLYMLQSEGLTESSSRWTVICPTKNVPFGQEPVFLSVYGMCLHLHNEIPRQSEDSLHTRWRREWRERKKEICGFILAT